MPGGTTTDGRGRANLPERYRLFSQTLKMCGPRDPYPGAYRIVVIKSANHFRAWWTDAANAIIDCDPPGIASNDLSTFTFAKKNRKVYSLDRYVVYPGPGA